MINKKNSNLVSIMKKIYKLKHNKTTKNNYKELEFFPNKIYEINLL